MGINDNNGQKGKRGFPNKETTPLNISKIPRDLSPNPKSETTKPPSDNKDLTQDKKVRKDKNLDEALKGTFPASDPAQQP